MDEFDNLGGLIANADAQAAGLDAPQGGALVVQEAGPAPMNPQFLQTAAMFVDMTAGLICGFAPEAASIWSDPAKQRVTEALAPVLQKYDFDGGAFPPELVLALAAGPLLWQSAKLIAAQAARDKRKSDADRTVDEVRPMASIVPQAGQEGAPDPAALRPAVHPQMALYRG